jgi:hypothetical protein
MPLLAIASAVSRTTFSFSPLHAYLFQLFQPIGGVFAKPLSSALPTMGNPVSRTSIAAPRPIPFLMLAPLLVKPGPALHPASRSRCLRNLQLAAGQEPAPLNDPLGNCTAIAGNVYICRVGLRIPASAASTE